MRTIVISALILSSCGHSDNTNFVDADLAPYISRFEQDLGVDASNVSASFASLSPPTLALCYQWSDNKNHIDVDLNAWRWMDDLGREQLVYHELGHCVLHQQHENELIVVGDGRTVYGSIMNQYWFGESWFYSTYRDNYKRALKIDGVMQP